LRSQANVLNLQNEIERLENVIADRRELYNDQVYRLNATIAQVPANSLAWLFDWRPRPFFATAAGERAVPDARLATD
jgi:LemA protein